MTVPVDQALLVTRVKTARGNLREAIRAVEGLAGQDGADFDRAYSTRAELKDISERLKDVLGEWENR